MKRLILCSDGLWFSREGQQDTPVARLARAILPVAADGTLQLVLHRWGQCTANPAPDPAGLDRDILELYRFLVHNHQPGDEIWLFGACRGAYGARACVGLLRNLGLLERAAARRDGEALRIYRTRWGADAANAVKFREVHCRPVAVHFMGLWDCLGPRGIPDGVFGAAEADPYRFHDSALSGVVGTACHALAIDEGKRHLPPAPWTTGPERSRTEQCWFSGTHADLCGGGRPALATPALAWIAARASAAGLALDRDALGDSGAAEDAGAIPQGGSRPRELGVTNQDETLHSSAEQRFLRDPRYRPANLAAFLGRDEQIRLPL
ncbi:MAG: DUF2235 domain-containing protein [Pseudomonadota bacterium]|nr:DUF2235 domain-containing protein [Pseudomonadota bacterium]